MTVDPRDGPVEAGDGRHVAEAAAEASASSLVEGGSASDPHISDGGKGSTARAHTAALGSCTLVHAQLGRESGSDAYGSE